MRRFSEAPAELERSHSSHQSKSDSKARESLEALWNPSWNDDGRATLEQLQSAVAAQGTSKGLNGTISYLAAPGCVRCLQ